MMKPTRYTLLLISVVLVAVLAACGATTAPAEPPETVDVVLSDLPQTVDINTAYALQNDPNVILLDVREQEEYDEKHIPGVTLLPMSTLESRLEEIPSDKTVIVTCRSGNRSAQVTEYLRANGFDNTHNMSGGIIAWEEAGYPVER